MAGAVSAAEEALKKVRGQPALKNREEEVLQRLGTAYQAAQRYPDAVRAFTGLLELRQEDCKPGPSFGERCADAEYGLGTALMYAGDFQAARGHLTVAVAGFSKMGTDGDEGYRMTKMKHKGDAESLLAAALFRSGDRVKAIEGFRRAIATLRVVESNEKADLAVRGAATNSIRDAEASLGMLEKK
jgi:tetratricopeptide (TPR) repeat protein